MALQHLRSSTADKRPTPGVMSDGQLAMNTNLASPGLFLKDSNGDLVKVGPVHVGTTAPNATPGAGGQAGNSKGELWLDTSGSDYSLKTWDGTAFRAIVVTSTMIKDGTIVDADVNASAAIAHTKLANITAGSVLLGNASNVPTATALSGDVTVSNAGVTAIGSGVIVNADVYASAAIAGTKISPDFGSQNVVTTGGLQGASINGGPLAGFRNAIVNGSFALAQRDTSFVAAANNDDSYNLDRWYVLSDGNDIVDITRDTATVPTNGKYAIALDVETVNKKFGIAQIIEADNCIGLIGGQVTLSFKARVSSTTNLDNVKAAIVAWSGTADTVTSDIVSAWNVEGTNPTLVANATYENTPANLNLTTSYATYSVTATVDTASTKNIVVFIWSDVTTTSLAEFVYITDVQVEAGPVATPFERRPISTELALCQRYYIKLDNSTNLSRVGAGFNTATTAASMLTFFPVKMRVPPPALEQSGTASDYQVVHGNTATTCSVVPAYNIASNDTAVTTFTVASGLTAGQGTHGRLSGGGFLAWSAEL